MADAYKSLANLVTLNDKNTNDYGVSDLFDDAPLLKVLAATVASNGTNHNYLKQTGSAGAAFRAVNAGLDNTVSTDTLVTIALKILDGSFAVDKAMADGYFKGAGEFVQREARRKLRAVFAAAELQVIGGTVTGSSSGFTGMADTLTALSNTAAVVGAGGSTATTGSSVYLIRTNDLGTDLQVVLCKDYWSTFRSLQIALVGACIGFVPRDADRPYNFTPAILFNRCNINPGSSSLEYDGPDPEDGTGVWSFTADTKYAGHGVYWTVMRKSMPYQSSTGTVGDDGKVIVSGFVLHYTDGTDDTDVGLSVLYSPGWSRYYPEWFQYPIDRTCFVPGYRVALNGSVTVIDPPEVELALDSEGNPLTYYDCSVRGVWETRPASTAPVQGASAFETGHYYRLVGGNFNDPGVTPRSVPSTFTRAMVHYWDHFYRGLLDETNQGKNDSSKHGEIASGNERSITAQNVDWWTTWCDNSFVQTQSARIDSVIPYIPADLTTSPITPEVPGHTTVSVSPPIAPCTATWIVTDDTDGSGTGTGVLSGTVGFTELGQQDVTLDGRFTVDMENTNTPPAPDNGFTVTFTFHGSMREETGTATGGDDVTLYDSVKDTSDNTQPFGCWWADAAFQGRPAYQGFVLEIIKGGGSSSSSDGEDRAPDFKTLITDTTSGPDGVVITFEPIDGLTVEEGDIYTIREPAYTLSRWKGCQLKITDPDHNHWEAEITASDADTLFFDPIDGFEVPDDWTGWKFIITEMIYGGVYKWDGAKMVTTAGLMDSVRLGVPEDPKRFLHDIRDNLEGFKKGWGPVEKGDVISVRMISEIYYVLNALKDTLQGITWTSRSDATVPEANQGLTETNVDAVGPQYDYGPCTDGQGVQYSFDSGPGGPGPNGECLWFGGPSDGLHGAVGDAQRDISACYARAKANEISGVDYAGNPYITGSAQTTCNGNESGHGYSEGIANIGEVNDGTGPYKASHVQADESSGGDCGWGGSLDAIASARYAYAVTQVRIDGVKTASSVQFWNYATFTAEHQDATFVTSCSCSNPFVDCCTLPADQKVINCIVDQPQIDFKDSGDPIQYNDWTAFGSGSPDGTGRTVSPRLGSVDLVALSPITMGTCTHTGTYWHNQVYGQAGYTVTDGKAVVKWDKEYDGPWVAPADTSTGV